MTGIHDTVGYDLVSHCVSDIMVQGRVRSTSSTMSPAASSNRASLSRSSQVWREAVARQVVR